MKTTCTQIISDLESAGYYAAFLPFNRLEQIIRHYDDLAEKFGTVEYLQNAVKHMREAKTDIPFTPLSFLVTAYADCPAEIVFNDRGKRQVIPIPPTYRNFEAMGVQLDELLKTAAEGYQITPCRGVSQKLLAVYSGLGRYGRNNIFYLKDRGSYFHLRAVITDIPCEDISFPMQFMDECGSCGLCRKNCPTGAITDAAAIDAGKCLTLMNEHKNPIPDWVKPEIHHAAIGCLRCQENCPQNKKLPAVKAQTLELDEAETEFLLSADFVTLTPGLEKKFRDFRLHEFSYGVIGRNARLILRK